MSSIKKAAGEKLKKVPGKDSNPIFPTMKKQSIKRANQGEGRTVRILLTGSREWTDDHFIANTILDVLEHASDNHIFVQFVIFPTAGAGKTILNTLDGLLSTGKFKYSTKILHADWMKYGKQASAVRNQEMIHSHRPDMVIGFMVDSAKKIGGNWDSIRRSSRNGAPAFLYLKQPDAPNENDSHYHYQDHINFVDTYRVSPCGPDALNAQRKILTRFGAGDLIEGTFLEEKTTSNN